MSRRFRGLAGTRHIGRREICVAAPLLLLSPRDGARAQGSEAWPTGPVRIIVPYAPGGAADQSIRSISDLIAQQLGQQLVIENRAGGAGSIGVAAAAQARPDGSTFLFNTSVHLVNALTMPGAATSYDGFIPVTQVNRLIMVIAVKSSLRAETLSDLLALARREPGTLACGNAGNTSSGQMIGARLERLGQVSLLSVPYRGGAEAARDLAAQTLDCAIITVPPLAPLVDSRRARMLAITSASRSPLLPHVPTVAESGFPGFEHEEWTGLFAPAGTPEPILARMQAAVAMVMRMPGTAERMAQLGAEPVGSTAAEFATFLGRSRATLASLIQDVGGPAR